MAGNDNIERLKIFIPSGPGYRKLNHHEQEFKAATTKHKY